MNTNSLSELRDTIETDVKAGFANRAEIIDAAIDTLLGDYEYDWIQEQAIRITDELLAQHYAEQRSWTGETDCDRLDEAFSELDRKGIVARQNFTCCQTCGHTEISYEIEKTSETRPVRGYVFFHMQDTESAVRNNYLYMAYGSVSGKEHEAAEIAEEVCKILRKAGLETDWNGSVRTRICIREINWQFRRDYEADKL